MPEKPQISRTEYPHFLALPTRWMDNDIYGHVNNALYYAFFDTPINEFLVAEGGLEINGDAVVAFSLELQCQYVRPLAFPGVNDFGLRVGKLGKSERPQILTLRLRGECHYCARIN